MAQDNDEPEVKDIERVEITPAPEGDELVEADETDPDSSQDETDSEADAEDEKKPDALAQRQPLDKKSEDGLVTVEGETPRERALRAELAKERDTVRKLRGGELDLKKPATSVKKELKPENVAVLAKYKPEEINSLREVFPALAEEMGFVREDQLAGNTYAEKAQESLDNFLDKHPEYTPENDTDGTLWSAFKTEYGLYKQPTNPKDFAKIFERIHKDVFGIQPKGALKTVNAQREKAGAASHNGASSTSAAPKSQRGAPQGLRTDMLKGFTDEEKAELLGSE